MYICLLVVSCVYECRSRQGFERVNNGDCNVPVVQFSSPCMHAFKENELHMFLLQGSLQTLSHRQKVSLSKLKYSLGCTLSLGCII